MRVPYVAGEYFKNVVLNADIDLTTATAMRVTIRRPDGSSVATPATPTVGVTDLTVDGITYAANHYAIYVTQDGDIPDNLDGYYEFQLTADFGASGRRKSVNRVLHVEN